MTDTLQLNIKTLFLEFLNWAIIVICLFLKIPQIFNLRNKRPSEIKGISLQAIAMEIAGYSIMTLYNYKNEYSLLTYLEYPVLLVQEYVMLFYVLRAKGYLRNKFTPLYIVFYIFALAAFMAEIIPKETLNYLVPFCLPLGGFAKISYIQGMIKASNSDAISLETWAMSTITNAGRLYSVYMDSADKNLMFNFGVSVILSGGVLGTAIYYQMLPPPRPCISTRRREPSVRRQYHVD